MSQQRPQARAPGAAVLGDGASHDPGEGAPASVWWSPATSRACEGLDERAGVLQPALSSTVMLHWVRRFLGRGAQNMVLEEEQRRRGVIFLQIPAESHNMRLKIQK